MSYETGPTTEAPPIDLRIVPLGRLASHELHDEQRATPLIRHIKNDGILKNPPVVTPASHREDRYIILDGANRAVALDVLSIPHIIVQVVPYEAPHVELQTWYHVISHIPAETLDRRFKALTDITAETTEQMHARALLAARAVLAYYLLPDGTATTLAGGGLDLHERTRLLQTIAGSYVGEGHLNRASTDDINELSALYPRMGAAVVYPRYEPVEILDLAQSGMPVPPGITRHIINGRALRINYPLAELKADRPLAEKNAELMRWLQEKFASRSVRFYAETTYMFDE